MLYGYEKADIIAAKSPFILSYSLQACKMLISSGKNILFAVPRDLPSIIAIYATLFSMIGKLGLAYYQSR